MANELDKPWGWELPEHMTEEQREYLTAWLNNTTYSAVSASPVLCQQSCKYAEKCPLAQMNIPLPVGRECPIERTILHNWATKMKEDLGILDGDSWSLMLLEIGGLLQVMLRRAWAEAAEDTVVIESFRGVDKEGNALFEKKVNPALAYADKLVESTRKIGEELIASKRAKAKLSTEGGVMGPEEKLRKAEARIEDVQKKMKDWAQRLIKENPPSSTSIEPSVEPPKADET